METSFKPVNIEEASQNPNNAGGSFSYAYEKKEVNSGINFFQIMLVLITMAMLFLTVGVFMWRVSLNSSIDSKKKELDIAQDKIGMLKLDDIKKLSTKLHAVKNLVGSYPFVGDILKILEHSVEAGVVYNKFSTHIDTVSGNYYVDISGISPDYRTLIQQIDILKSDPIYIKYFLNSEISDFKLNEKGNVEFSFKIKSNINGFAPIDVVNDLSISKENYIKRVIADATTTNVTITEATTTNVIISKATTTSILINSRQNSMTKSIKQNNNIATSSKKTSTIIKVPNVSGI